MAHEPGGDSSDWTITALVVLAVIGILGGGGWLVQHRQQAANVASERAKAEAQKAEQARQAEAIQNANRENEAKSKAPALP